MPVINIHERTLNAPIADVGTLIDSLASKHDILWPRDRWPAMKFDRPLAEGAVGGHGPIRYIVKSYQPGVAIRFRFTGPVGFTGTHGFEAARVDERHTRLTHTIDMRVSGMAWIQWHLAIRSLHDALMDDCLDQAEASLRGERPVRRNFSPWVNILRRAVRKRT